jgi:hypothetical protein
MIFLKYFCRNRLVLCWFFNVSWLILLLKGSGDFDLNSRKALHQINVSPAETIKKPGADNPGLPGGKISLNIPLAALRVFSDP